MDGSVWEKLPTRQKRDVDPMMGQCCSTVYDGGATLPQHCSNALSFFWLSHVKYRPIYFKYSLTQFSLIY